jgi:hypothetical protein
MRAAAGVVDLDLCGHGHRPLGAAGGDGGNDVTICYQSRGADPSIPQHSQPESIAPNGTRKRDPAAGARMAARMPGFASNRDVA